MKKNVFLNSKKIQIAFFSLAGMFILSCSNFGYKSAGHGILYKIESKGTDRRIKIGDFIVMNIAIKNGKDSVINSTWETGTPARFQTREGKYKYDLMNLFLLLNEKDSATIKIPIDSIFNPTLIGSMRPPYFAAHTYEIITVKMEKVLTKEQFLADGAESRKNEEKLKEKLKAEESPAIARYIQANHLKPDSTTSGVLYVIKKEGSGLIPKLGDTVSINYIGRRLDGKVFDTNDSLIAKANHIFNLARKQQRGYGPSMIPVGGHHVVPGLDDYLQTAKEGTKALVIVPSKLAYKEFRQGAMLPPYSTMIFDVELLDVKPLRVGSKKRDSVPKGNF